MKTSGPLWRFLSGLAAWTLLAAGFFLLLYFKHPFLYRLRPVETPLLILAAVFGGWLANRRRRANPDSWRRLEAGLRLGLWLLLGSFALGGEAWFLWQKHAVLAGGVAMERMGRHFVVGFRRFEDVQPLAERGLIGGIYLGKRNLAGESIESLRARIDALQALRRKAGLPPLFVMADQEGGIVSHLSPLIEPLPSLATLGPADGDFLPVRSGSADDGFSLREGDASPTLEERAYAYGKRQGTALARLGVNMNLAPVVDLKPAQTSDWSDRHTLIARRAISADPQIVVRVASAYGQGLVESGIQPTVKHFPGLRAVRGDTHLVPASLVHTPKERQADWLPFREVTARTGAAMMLAHVHLPEIDPNRPASLSRILVQKILRGKGDGGWNYQGILMTDDLNMGAVYADGIGLAATRALDAGVDLILISYDPDQYYPALFQAARSWRQDRIGILREAESARRLDHYWMQRPGN
jgi:beta-N-acetylhexosaminidase